MSDQSDPQTIFDEWKVQLSGNDILSRADSLIIEKGPGNRARVFQKVLLGEGEVVAGQLLRVEGKAKSREFTLGLSILEAQGKKVLYGTMIDKNSDIGGSGATAVFGADTEGKGDEEPNGQ